MKQKFVDAFMDCAERFAQLSHATRAKVGAIIVKDNRIISIGYNGMPSGWDNECEDWVPHDGVRFAVHEQDRDIYGVYKTKPEVLHAETNAIAKWHKVMKAAKGQNFFAHTCPV